ncbi:MAG: hypothetical protein A2636_05115 [Elusimicrobia bacterium RIFCSPHIGHO2_01_FULL_64_10]|nr:MAG: hypothetical protein A2636_05115 [Elusimicrobia bacterium RIFCSPHIGHO2_01_FULL_64_10]
MPEHDSSTPFEFTTALSLRPSLKPARRMERRRGKRFNVRDSPSRNRSRMAGMPSEKAVGSVSAAGSTRLVTEDLSGSERCGSAGSSRAESAADRAARPTDSREKPVA